MTTLSKTLLVAAGGLVVSAGVALARPAVVETDLNLRARAGTYAPVIVVLPGGATVEVHECRGGWCAVSWRGYDGYASASYLGPVGYGPRRYRRPPPPYYYDPYYYDPGVGVTIRLGDDDRRRKGRRHRDRDRDGDRRRHSRRDRDRDDDRKRHARDRNRDGKSKGGLNDFRPVPHRKRDYDTR